MEQKDGLLVIAVYSGLGEPDVSLCFLQISIVKGLQCVS
jgi:hypothetical protein